MNDIRIFYLKISIFFCGVKFSVYLNRHSFVMNRFSCAQTHNDPDKSYFYAFGYKNKPIQIY